MVRDVVFIGAGVTALTSALYLARAAREARQDLRITLVARNLPGDEVKILPVDEGWSSPWAGAHWRTAEEQYGRVARWDRETYEVWRSLLAEGKGKEAGLQMQTSTIFYAIPPGESFWFKEHVQKFRRLGDDEKSVRGVNSWLRSESGGKVVWAGSFESPSLDPDVYLPWLQRQCEDLGVRIRRGEVGKQGGSLKAVIREAEKLARVSGAACVVNCSGLGAKEVCGDDTVMPIRGQTVLVRGEASATRSLMDGDSLSYVIPRPGSGMTVLGGTKEKGRALAAAEDATTTRIVRNAKALAPELLNPRTGEFDIVDVRVGFRPGRHGGPRVESEQVGSTHVVHAYGHGGAGYQNSVGSAREVVHLVLQGLKAQDQKAKL